ncbi:MAG: hypothetical protein U0174_21875 [Polyangiaceae bacterium]
MPVSRRFFPLLGILPPVVFFGLACGTSIVSIESADGGVHADAAPVVDPLHPETDANLDGSSPQGDARLSDAKVGDSGKKDASPDGGPLTTGAINAEKYCTPLCDFAARCSKNISACSNGGAPCLAEATPLASFWRDEYADAFNACYPALACTSSPDECIVDGFVASDPAWPEVPYVQDCLTKRKSCSNPFADDLCLSLVALTDAYRAQADACRALPCAQVGPCLRAAGAFAY